MHIDPFERGREDYRRGRPTPARPGMHEDEQAPHVQRFYGFMLEKAWQEVRAECWRVIYERDARLR